jgi:hypothetical protein
MELAILQTELAKMRAKKEQHLAEAHACTGAIQTLEWAIAMESAPKPETDPTPTPEAETPNTPEPCQT